VPEAGYNVVDLLARCKLCASKSDARRLVQQGGVTFNGEKPADVAATVSVDDLKAGVVIRKGKKVYHKAIVE
jgi:tyrosyl-tRNA synthetase